MPTRKMLETFSVLMLLTLTLSHITVIFNQILLSFLTGWRGKVGYLNKNASVRNVGSYMIKKYNI